jgi:hypothetical protein
MSSKSTFLDEFAEMIERGYSEKLIICGDLNMPGLNSNSTDDLLLTLLQVHGYQEHVTEPTRGKNLLNLVITSPSSQNQSLVSNVTVVSLHELSGHNLVVCDFSVRSN